MDAFSTTNTQEADAMMAHVEEIDTRIKAGFRNIHIAEFVIFVLVMSMLMLAGSLALESYLKENQEVFATWKR